MVVSIGSAANENPGEFNGIVAGDARLRFAVTNYTSLLGQFVATLQAAICSQAARVGVDTLVNRTLGVNETIYLRYDNVTQPLNLNLTVARGGDVRMCLSYSEPNPSTRNSSRNDGCAGVGDASGSSVVTGVPPNAVNGSTIYVVCENTGADAASFQLAASSAPTMTPTSSKTPSSSTTGTSSPTRTASPSGCKGATAVTAACSTALDVVFVLDSSGSIGTRPFDSARQFINDTLAAFDFDDERVRRAGPHRPSVRTWHTASCL
jgi:hypothetical protein